jgi:anthranilate synthase component 2
MAVRHRSLPHIQGVQFHPESIITDSGMRIVKNFVDSLQG